MAKAIETKRREALTRRQAELGRWKKSAERKNPVPMQQDLERFAKKIERATKDIENLERKLA